MSSVPKFEMSMWIHNKYGYEINISHAKIAPLFKRYMLERKLPFCFPISDKERFVFEAQLKKVWKKREKRQRARKVVEKSRQKETA